jgi:glycosyltransferase involved in cell wall biosynthesis
MRDEMVRQGVAAHRVHVVPPFVAPREIPEAPPATGDATIRLLFLGRLEPLKGVSDLIDALPMVATSAARAVVLTVAGEGAERSNLEDKARRVEAADPRVSVHFAGWQDAAGRDRLLADCHALVVPSLWPEPFGLVGLEAAAAGVPAVAFASGGVVDWLKDGITGCLAPTGGARPSALAGAILRCVADPAVRNRLAAGARELSAGWTLDRHLTMLDRVFALAAGSAGGSEHP